ncbi:MAG: CPBP family intramembrane metalloprotease [Oscillospiraceae bacterium]|nr:CPBP family intramembrane metalloprotease [Oscillospiraceae bacterium]
MSIKRELTVGKIVIYCIVFFAIWTVRELPLRYFLTDTFGETANAVTGTLIKLTVWTLPAALLIEQYKCDMRFSLKEMLTNKFKWIPYIILLTAFFLYYSVSAWISFGTFAIHPEFKPLSLIGVVIFVGITEEVVFRGWLLNAALCKADNRKKTWFAVLINAVLFTLIHFPIWFYREYDAMTFLVTGAGVAGLSVLFSWTFIKSKNIFVPIVLHMGWNLFTILFFG